MQSVKLARLRHGIYAVSSQVSTPRTFERAMATSNGISVRELPSRNPDPSTAKAHHIGNPPTHFKNPWPSYREWEGGRFGFFKLKFGSHPEKSNVPVPEGPNGTRSEKLVKVLKPTWGVHQPEKLRATWIGHASFLIETPAVNGAERGIRILCDGVFSERTSPVGFLGPKRYTPTPCSLDELPDPDVVIISHNHYGEKIKEEMTLDHR